MKKLSLLISLIALTFTASLYANCSSVPSLNDDLRSIDSIYRKAQAGINSVIEIYNTEVMVAAQELSESNPEQVNKDILTYMNLKTEELKSRIYSHSSILSVQLHKISDIQTSTIRLYDCVGTSQLIKNSEIYFDAVVELRDYSYEVRDFLQAMLDQLEQQLN